jgi:hypothetical protein
MGTKFGFVDDGGRSRSFDVAFHYNMKAPVCLYNNGGRTINRDVTLAFVTETFKGGADTTYTGMAVRRPDEAFNKETGRNAALTHILLEQLCFDEYELVNWFAAYNKAKYQVVVRNVALLALQDMDYGDGLDDEDRDDFWNDDDEDADFLSSDKDDEDCDCLGENDGDL